MNVLQEGAMGLAKILRAHTYLKAFKFKFQNQDPIKGCKQWSVMIIIVF